MDSPDDKYNIIKESIQLIIGDCKIVLFGSRAIDKHNTESDYDFLIVTDKNYDISEKRELKALIRKKLAQKSIPADIIIQSNSEVELKKKLFGHIVREAIKKGVEI